MVLAALTGCTGPAPARVGNSFPLFRDTTLNGDALDLSDLRGQPLVVNFWASWCVPCREEFPLFEAALADHASDRLQIVGVLFKDSTDAAQSFVESHGGTWPTAADQSYAIATELRVIAAPQTYFVDRSGVIRSIQYGEITKPDLDRQLAAILK